MANSSILGIDHAADIPAGRSRDELGPSDSSDSGSDVRRPAGSNAEADAALAEILAQDAQASDTDSTSTGESASASDDDEVKEAADIAPDRIVDAAQAGISEGTVGPMDEADDEDRDAPAVSR